MAAYALCLDTTGPILTLGLSNFESVHRCQFWELGRDLSTHLHRYLSEFIRPQTWSDLAWIAVVKGPGSFTGTRIGMVTARTLAEHLQLPLFSLSTLAVMAWAQAQPFISRASASVIAAELPARRDYVYGGIYKVSRSPSNLTALCPDQLTPIKDWNRLLQQQSVLHSTIKANEITLMAKEVCNAALGIAQQQWTQGDRPAWQEALPYYG